MDEPTMATVEQPLILQAFYEHIDSPKLEDFIPKEPLYKENKSRCVRGVGPQPAKIMFIGEAPGAEEDDRGVPFVGRAGRYLDECLLEAGIDRKQVWITNLVKERPPDNRVPTTKEIRAYLPYLIAEIKRVQPKVIVLLGAPALKTFLGLVGITRIHGQIFSSKEFDCKVVPIFHPSYVMRKAEVGDVSVRQKFVGDLTRIKQFVEMGAISDARKPTTYYLIDTIEKFDLLVKKLHNALVVDFDLETTSTDPQTGKIICISFSINECKAAVVPLFVDGKDYWKEPDYLHVMQQLQYFFLSNVSKCAHAGALVDIPFLRAAGIEINRYDFDTIIMDYLLDENKLQKKRGLKELAWEYTDMGGYDSEVEEWKDKILNPKKKEYFAKRKSWRESGENSDDEPEKPEISFGEIPFDILWRYSAADADCVGRLRRIFYPKLEKQDLLPLMKKVVMPLQMVLCKMEERGVKIDTKQLAAIRAEYQELSKGIEAQLNSHPVTTEAKLRLEADEINYSSTKQLRTILFEILGLTPIKKSKKTGVPSTDEDSLKELESLHEIPRLIMQKRRYDHLVSYYGEKFEQSIRRDGRIHTSYYVYGTETGRLSSKRPNLQNIPRPPEPGDENSEISARIRDIFVAEPGHVLIDADLAQIEFRLLANYTQDTQMIRDIVDKVDIHNQNAELVYTITGKQVSRQEAKGLTYALIYGASEYRIAELFNIDVSQGLEIKEALFRKYPGARRFHNLKKAEATTSGFVKNLFGRRRRLPGIVSADKKIRGHAERSSINSPIQGLVADIIGVMMVRLDRIWESTPGIKVYPLIMQTHDSLTHEFPEAQRDMAISTIHQEMTRPIQGIVIPVEVDIKVGRSLGNMKKLSADELKEVLGRAKNHP